MTDRTELIELARFSVAGTINDLEAADEIALEEEPFTHLALCKEAASWLRDLQADLALAAVRLGICTDRMRGVNDMYPVDPPHQLIGEVDDWVISMREALGVPPTGDILHLFPRARATEKQP